MSKNRRFDKRRAAALGMGVALIAVPTLFTVNPGWTKWDGRVRGGLLFVWLIIAAVVILTETVRSDVIHNLASDRSALLKNLRLTGIKEVLEALLRSGTRDIPPSYAFTLYLYRKRANELIPYFPKLMPPKEPDPRTFKPGKGATGLAWQNQEVVTVRGEDVSNEAYGLTPEQQQYYAGYKSVAAAVVWEENTRPIGVLTALSKDDDGYFDTPAGRDSLKVLAEAIGVALNRIPEPDDLGLEEA